MTENGPLTFRYHFTFSDGRTVSLEANLDPQTLEYIPPDGREVPAWAQFDYLPCAQCVEKSRESIFCPIAANVRDVIEAFQDVYSFENVDVVVETQDRLYTKKQFPIQQALSSFLGIIMVSSGCEDLDKLRPMVKFHLPFATFEETIYRAASMYLLAQYFRGKHGMDPDWDIQELVDIYQRISSINANLCKRLQNATEKDAGLNAVVILDTFTKMVPFSIEDALGDIEHLFSPYLP